MNKLYLRIPAKHTMAWPDGKLDYALRSKDGSSLREGQGTLTELSSLVSKSSVVLLIAATDVTLLDIVIPPMPDSKLKLALPNLVEDKLVSDLSDNILILAGRQDDTVSKNTRTVAIASRSWLQQLFSSLHGLGASHIKALPAQLCIPLSEGRCGARIDENAQNSSAIVSMRFGLNSGVGILLGSAQSTAERLSTLVQMSQADQIELELPNELLVNYKSALEADATLASQVTLRESVWPKTIEEAKAVSFNLMAGLNVAQSNQIQWRIWRWPLILAALIVLINVVGLNSEYWSLKREVASLKTGMAQTYKASFPKDAVVPFPLEQMKKNLETAQRNAGQAASYDFTVLLTEFGSVWDALGSTKLPKIVSIEYKEYALLIQVKGSMPQEQVQQALSQRGLNFKKMNAETWQVKDAE